MPCSSQSTGFVGSFVILALSAGLLSGCGGGETVGEALGYEQTGPDELSIIKRPPLTIPPDYNLRPPRPGDPASNADSASEAARETLVGPSSKLAPEAPAVPDQTTETGSSTAELTSPQERAKATLVGNQQYQKSPPLIEDDEQVAATATETTPSAGQTALLSRTNRVERDLDALDETRAENRVDGALLRRLLAWQSPEAGENATVADNGSVPRSDNIVKIVRREQTPVNAGAGSN